jgi:hypothetical protein
MYDKDTKTAKEEYELEYVKQLPGFTRGKPKYFNDKMHDHLLEICLHLAGEIWVNRDRQLITEHLLSNEGVVTPEMIEKFRPSKAMKESMLKARKSFTEGIFGKLYDELD